MSANPNPAETSEPNTPMWLPAVGALLFALVGVWWATRPAPPSITADTAADAGTEVAPAQAAAPPDAGALPAHLAAAGGTRPGSEPRSARPPADPGRAADIQRMLNRIPKQR